MNSSSSIFQLKKYFACIMAQGNCLAAEITSLPVMGSQEVDSDMPVQADSSSQEVHTYRDSPIDCL